MGKNLVRETPQYMTVLWHPDSFSENTDFKPQNNNSRSFQRVFV
jgi:hypothetical protein